MGPKMGRSGAPGINCVSSQQSLHTGQRGESSVTAKLSPPFTIGVGFKADSARVR